MADEDQSKTVRIDFHIPPDFPVRYASNLVVQHTKHDFTITFFDIRPPLLIGTMDEKAAQLEEVAVLTGIPLARIVVAASRMHEFVRVMQDNLETYRKAMAGEAAVGDDE